MRKPPDRDVEALLRDANFANPAHKEALCKRLFADGTELELDDLAMVAGGWATIRTIPIRWPHRLPPHWSVSKRKPTRSPGKNPLT